MPFGDYATGLAFFAGTTGAAIGAAALIARRRLDHLTGAPKALGLALLATTGVLAAHLVPGILGVLSRWSALGSAALLLLAATRVRAADSTAPDVGGGEANGGGQARPAPPPSSRSSWALATAATVILSACVAGELWHATVRPSTGIDTLTFHLPNVARWIQSGTFWQVDQFTPLLFNGNYPHNGDVVFLAAVLPWENDAFVRLVNAPFVAIAALSVYAIAREIGAPSATAALFGAVFAALPVVSLSAYGGAQTDPIMLGTFGAGALFLIRHFRTRGRADLLLAGLGLGLAFGTKWYGVSSVLVVLAVWVGASLVARRPLNRLAREGGTLAGLIALAGGFWLIRNLVESGNPINPVKVELFGLTLFDAARDFVRECGGFTIANYLGDPGIWSTYILPAYEENYGLPGLAIALGVIGTIAIALGNRGHPGRGSRRRWARLDLSAVGGALAVAASALVLAAAYSVTPYTALGPEDEPLLVGANARYLTPALMMAAAASAWSVGCLGRFRLVFEAVGLAAVADGVRRGFDVPVELVLGVVAALAAAGVAAYLLTLGTQGLSPGVRLAVRAGFGAMAAAAVAAAGHERQQEFNQTRYVGSDRALDWIARNAPRGHRIGLAGVWTVGGLSPVWPAFGPRLGNRVEFVGEFVHGQLREYDDPMRWGDAIRRNGYDLLVVGEGGYGACRVPGSASDDNEWARRAGFPLLAASDRLRLYRVTSSSARSPKRG